MPEETTSLPQAPGTSRTHLARIGAILLVLLILAAIGGGLYLLQPRAGSYSRDTTPFDVLYAKNAAFAEAQSLFNAKQYLAAKAKYEEALAAATDPIQEGQIRYKIARSLEESGLTSESIAAYKEIGMNPAYANYPMVRAYAVQQLGLMYLMPDRQQYAAEIFSGEPYASLLVSGNREMTKKNIFEYASSQYPLAISELQSAIWYADQNLIAVAKKEEPSLQYMNTIRTKLKNADADIVRITNDENERNVLLTVLIRRAQLLGKISRIDDSVPQAEVVSAFEKAISINSLTPGGDGYARYFYAHYLLKAFGTEGVDTLKRVLMPVYTKPEYQGSPVVAYFKSERENKQGDKATIAAMAKLVPEFKSFLVTLGWQQSDF